ncbi:MAG TPA: hypothetical protein DEP69_02520 [Acidimicrobiaceae bacterium]|nr:hypothetical protein [Acidimicrobiaceae bacterium]
MQAVSHVPPAASHSTWLLSVEYSSPALLSSLLLPSEFHAVAMTTAAIATAAPMKSILEIAPSIVLLL